MRILVGHASAHGSTAEIARRIAEVLRGQGASVDVERMGRITDPGGYDAVVLGSAVHHQAWLPEATGFVRRHRGDLLARPVWLFSVGMSAGLPRLLRRPAHRAQDRRLAAALRDVVRPRGHLLLSGVTGPDLLPGPTCCRARPGCSSGGSAATSATTGTGQRSRPGPGGSPGN